MYVAHLTLHAFRSYDALELELGPGVTSFIGRNGQGKTNIVEAVDYLSRLTSHRVAQDAPLVKQGAERAVVRAAVVKDGRSATIEVEINPGRANRARVNRAQLGRAREVVGLVRTVLFSPEDLALVKGDPAERRRYLDDLLVLRAPRLAAVRSDYERVLRQRNALLRSATTDRRRSGEHWESTLDVWDAQLVRFGAELTVRRAALVAELDPLVARAYAAVATGAARSDAELRYRPSVGVGDGAGPGSAKVPVSAGARDVAGVETMPSGAGEVLTVATPQVESAFRAELARRRDEEVHRGITLVGPHRDEVALAVGSLPLRGYASHGESWSFALAMRLAGFELLRADGDDPILVLDDVFAELDADRRERLAALVGDAEQVLVTAAVDADVPAALHGARVEVRREDGA
jgi:DNA replication and repair protein RecF